MVETPKMAIVRYKYVTMFPPSPHLPNGLAIFGNTTHWLQCQSNMGLLHIE